MTTKPTKQDLAQANKMLSREARLEDMEAVAQLLADLRAARTTADNRWIETPDGLAKCPRCEQKASDEPNPTTGLWDKRNTPSGYFEAVKRSGDVFKGVKREN